MSRKKKVQVRARKVKSTGVWIAPDLERKIKGEGGRRGLTEPPYSYYLYLADLALKSEPGPRTSAKSPKAPDPWPGSSMTRTATTSESPGAEGDSILLTNFPVSVPPKPPKVTLAKPPKAPSTPKPAKRLPTKPLRRQAPKKLRLPKPPKRGR